MEKGSIGQREIRNGLCIMHYIAPTKTFPIIISNLFSTPNFLFPLSILTISLKTLCLCLKLMHLTAKTKVNSFNVKWREILCISRQLGPFLNRESGGHDPNVAC